MSCNNIPSFTNTAYTTERFPLLQIKPTKQSAQPRMHATEMAFPGLTTGSFRMHRWNPFGLITMFEFFSAGFALFYVREKILMPEAARRWIQKILSASAASWRPWGF